VREEDEEEVDFKKAADEEEIEVHGSVSTDTLPTRFFKLSLFIAGPQFLD
jgi:hypothetical protein